MSKHKEKQTQKTVSSQVVHTLTSKDLGVDTKQALISNVSFSEYVRVLLQNWRQGTVACKGRSDVAYSNKKPWKQKGTGRARAGSKRSPLWRGGGITFGPQARTKTLKITKNVKKGVLRSLLMSQIDNGLLSCIDWSLQGDKPQTSAASTMLKNAGLNGSKVTIFVPMSDVLTYASFANIPNVRILFFDQANAFDLVNSTHWVVFKKDLDLFKRVIEKWI